MMMRARSVPIRSGRRYLKETFESDHRSNLPCFMRHLPLFTVRRKRLTVKQICRTAGQPSWELCTVGRYTRECDVSSGLINRRIKTLSIEVKLKFQWWSCRSSFRVVGQFDVP